MNYENWVAEMRLLLVELHQLDFGYPPLTYNLVLPPNTTMPLPVLDSRLEWSKHIHSFYQACDGIRWQNVRNGYFICSRNEFGRIKNQYDPTSLAGSLEGDIVVIGSTGGGELYALRQLSGDVLYLPHSLIEKNVYFAKTSEVKVAAKSFDEFLRRLGDDLKAFIVDDQDHEYLLT